VIGCQHQHDRFLAVCSGDISGSRSDSGCSVTAERFEKVGKWQSPRVHGPILVVGLEVELAIRDCHHLDDIRECRA
jgi:hypothetical protein